MAVAPRLRQALLTPASIAAGLLAAALISVAGTGFGQMPTNRDYSKHTDLREQGFPINTELQVASAEKAALHDSDIVIGIEIGGEARAYPVNTMWGPTREVLNDTIGHEPVAISWCSLAHSAVVFDPRLAGHPLVLGQIGAQNGVSILYDKQSGSWWSQIVGKAFRGPMQGRELRRLPSTLTTWGRWRQLHPDTTVYVDPGVAAPRRFTDETWGWIIALARDGAVANQDLVAGVLGPKSARAWLLRHLYRVGRVLNDAIDGEAIVVCLGTDMVTVSVLTRSVDERTLTFRADGDSLRDEQTGSVWDAVTGRAISGPLVGKRLARVVSTTALWYAWRSQRPDTTLWDELARSSARDAK